MFGRDKLDLVFVSFLNIAIAGQNSVAPRQNFIKNEIQLVMFLSESLSVRVTLMTQISQSTIPHSPIPNVTKLIPGLRTLIGNFFREIFTILLG